MTPEQINYLVVHGGEGCRELAAEIDILKAELADATARIEGYAAGFDTQHEELLRLTAELAAKEIHWTDAKPTSEGWWWNRRYASWPEQALLVRNHQRLGLVVNEWSIRYETGQWSDKPIPLPEERECHD